MRDAGLFWEALVVLNHGSSKSGLLILRLACSCVVTTYTEEKESSYL